jgi:hypothetical protein
MVRQLRDQRLGGPASFGGQPTEIVNMRQRPDDGRIRRRMPNDDHLRAHRALSMTGRSRTHVSTHRLRARAQPSHEVIRCPRSFPAIGTPRSIVAPT